MTAPFDTKSERLFATICEREGHGVEKLPESRTLGVKVPDLRITTSSGQLFAEVKELRANEDDLKASHAFKTKGICLDSSSIGANAREHIRAAARQLKRQAQESCPLIVVLYNNMKDDGVTHHAPMFRLAAMDIDAAMYGSWVTHVPVGPTDLVADAPRRPDNNGPGRTTTAEEKRYISAVAVVSDGDDETVLFYHNTFADVPLQQSWFRNEKCRHLFKDGDPHAKPHAWTRRPDQT